jgi:hypothetical protein
MPYIFKHTDDISAISIEMKIDRDDLTLDSVLVDFTDFLRACGFSWIDTIQHVKEDEELKLNDKHENIEPNQYQSNQMDWISAKGFEPSEK